MIPLREKAIYELGLDSLQLSPRTVDTHRANIAQKLGTTSVAEFARLALIGQAP